MELTQEGLPGASRQGRRLWQICFLGQELAVVGSPLLVCVAWKGESQALQGRTVVPELGPFSVA